MNAVELNLYRHGHVGRNDVTDLVFGQTLEEELDALGLAQAEELSVYQLDNGLIPDYVVSSHAERALQTANIVVGRLALSGRLAPGVTVIQDRRLVEQCLGKHEGMPRAEVYTQEVKYQIGLQLADYRHPGKGGESMRDTSTRGLAALSDSARLAEARGYKQVDLYSHNMTIAATLAQLEGHTSSKDMHDYIRQMLLSKRLGNVSRTLVIWDNNRLKVELIGEPTVI